MGGRVVCGRGAARGGGEGGAGGEEEGERGDCVIGQVAGLILRVPDLGCFGE